MRLADNLKQLLIQLSIACWGANSKIYLFGSRVDDHKMGGDIDLAIACNMSKTEFQKKKRQFKVMLMQKDIEIPIDVIDLKNTKSQLLQQEISDTGVQLYPDLGLNEAVQTSPSKKKA